MINSIETAKNKTLKLQNVLIRELINPNLSEEEAQARLDTSMDIVVEQMESQIRAKGTMALGPVIQYVNASADDEGEIEMTIQLLRQANNPIHKVDSEYTFAPTIRVTNCFYARYQGPEDKLQLAYQKLHIMAFEEDIPLKGDSYTIFVDGDEEGNIVADVFMERADGN